MFNKQLVRDLYGQYYKIHTSREQLAPGALEPKHFHSTSQAYRFINDLVSTVNYWKALYYSESLIAVHISSENDLKSKIAELLYRGKLKAYEVKINSSENRSLEKRTLVAKNKDRYTFTHASRLLFNNPKEYLSFTDKKAVTELITSLSPDRISLQKLVEELDLPRTEQDDEFSELTNLVVEGLASGEIIILLDKYTTPPFASENSNTEMHDDKDASKGPEKPVCSLDSFLVQCSHYPNGRSYRLDVLNDKPNLNGVDKSLQVIARDGDPDKIQIDFSGSCGCGNKNCPSIVIDDNSAGGTYIKSPHKFDVIPNETTKTPDGFLDFLRNYLVPEFNTFDYRVSSISKGGCNGSEGLVAKVHTFPTFKWSGDVFFGYTKKDEKDKKTGKTKEDKGWSYGYKIAGNIANTNWNLGSDSSHDNKIIPKLQSVLEGFFDQLNKFYGEADPNKGNKFEIESKVSIGGELELQEKKKDFSVDLGGNVNLSLNPLLKADIKYDLLEGIINRITGGIAPVLKRIKEESDKAKKASKAIEKGAEKLNEIKKAIEEQTKDSENNFDANISLDLIIRGITATTLKWNKTADQPWGITSGDVINESTARIELIIEGIAEAEASVFYVKMSLGAKFMIAGAEPDKGIGIELKVFATTEDEKPALGGQVTFTGAAIYYAYWAEFGVKSIDSDKKSNAASNNVTGGMFGAQIKKKEDKVKKEKYKRWTEIFKSRTWPEYSSDKPEEQKPIAVTKIED